MSQINPTLRIRLATQAQRRCGYCQTQEIVSGVPLTVEHIIPKARGGTDDENNLWLSCRLCNEAKGILVEAVDPQTNKTTPLFNPRKHNWADHFQWNQKATEIIGTSSIGRATVTAISLNTVFRIKSRAIWVEVGWHPPQ